MSDLMIGYYLVSGTLFLFFVGSGSIICDMFLNKEKTIIIRKPKPEIKMQSNLEELVSNDYEFDDDLMVS
jgi:hypothetical protein